MEKLPPLTTKQLRTRVEESYNLLKEEYPEHRDETVQGAVAVLHIERLRMVLRLAQHDPPLQHALARLLSDSVDPTTGPDPVTNPRPLRVADLLHLLQNAKLVLDEYIEEEQRQGAGDGSAPGQPSTGPTDSGGSSGPFEDLGSDRDSGLHDPGDHGYRSTRRGGARSCSPVDRHHFIGT